MNCRQRRGVTPHAVSMPYVYNFPHVDDSSYIASTGDLESRVAEHDDAHVGGSLSVSSSMCFT